MYRNTTLFKNDLISGNHIDNLISNAIFSDDTLIRNISRRSIRDIAFDRGIFPASMQGLYETPVNGICDGMTIPAINIRGITYHVARALFRAALKYRVGAFVFELARSEMIYTDQRPAEYSACILAAAVREGDKRFCS